MSTSTTSAQSIELPSLPADHAEWISHVSNHPEESLHELIAPYKEYDSKLREIYAQQPQHPAIAKSNVVPIFAGREKELKIRARKLDGETEADRQCYIMPLKKADRKANGSPAVVQSLKEFQTNFQLFSESSLVDMDWSNVVVAGSAVVTSLLPVPEKHNASKRALREYYHQQLAPASDVDLFLYDLTEEQAVEKIKQIEQRIRDSILTETTTVRTKNAITIASQYPTRHVQIVLRIYRSISEILTGFDVDCSCAAYDGSQVYASPRALAAYMTQINTVDLTRRSPSYENRLSKYSRRGFEIHWPLLDRSRIDPTLFERSFGRTLGLARLLVLEKLPKNTDREAYVDQRRAERGRPTINRWASRKLKGNIKEEHDDDVAEWVETDEVSDYHTFTIPYGPKYHARKIERLLYAKDLLLNAEWNRPKERETTLHRHPAFFGNADDVIGDCCGYCPEAITPEDKEIAEDESKTYVSGELSFIKDNPGRQAIGSFNPLTDDDWTEMAYVGNTARLCQAIVDGDLECVEDWLSQEGADPNRRDYTGRTPLHLAVITSTPQIVQRLIDADARIVARLVDGKTALHLAAMRGEAEMVRRLLMKSEANEDKEAEKEMLKRKAHQKAAGGEDQEMSDVPKAPSKTSTTMSAEEDDASEDDEEIEDSDIDMLDDVSDNADATTENSIVRIDRNKAEDNHENLPDNPSEDEPDVYDVDVLAWDAPVSALHLAIANGHTSVVQVLVQEFGADVLLPVKLLNDFNKSARAAILPIVLALQLPAHQARQMTTLLLQLGASPAQADMENITALQYFAANGVDLLRTMISVNRPSAQRAAGHLSMSGHQYNPSAKSILQTAIDHCDVEGVEILLELGAKPQIDYAAYTTSFKSKWDMVGDADRNEKQFHQNVTQPIMAAVNSEVVPIVMKLLDAGADMNTLTTTAWRTITQGNSYGSQESHSLLDAVRQKVKHMQEFVDTGKVCNSYGSHHYNAPFKQYPPVPLKEDNEYLKEYDSSSYMHWRVSKQLEDRKILYQKELEAYEERVSRPTEESKGTEEKKTAVEALLNDFKALEAHLVEKGAKTFAELHPDTKLQQRDGYGYRGYEPEPPKPWVPLASFQVPDLTDERRAAYVKLFEACWDANLSIVKDLTLAVWGESQSPLQIAVFDSSGFSPFSIALLRKHYDVAKAILEIAQAQYAPEQTEGQTKHTLQTADDDDGDSEISEDDVQIYAEIIDDKFTVENIGEVQSKVKSKVAPHSLITANCPTYQFLEDDDPSAPAWANAAGLTRNRWGYGYGYSRDRRAPRKIIKDAANGRTYREIPQPIDEDIQEVLKPGNLIQHAICLDDTDLLDLLITMAEEQVSRGAETTDGTASKFYQLPEADLLYAIRLGRVQLLQEIITRTGSGIPLDDLVKKSGIEVPKKPKFYQGLSVHGKKREDWANAGREVQETTQEQHPPILHAARLGSLESVEWFSGDASLRCYMEFANSHDGDVRIQNLAKAKGGLETTITKWLNLRSHLLLHCVVLGKTTEQSLQLLQTLCKNYPEALEHRSSSGMTPLHLAFRLQRVEMIKVLLEAGAQQTCRDNTGNNIVHTILTNSVAIDDKGQARLRELLSLVDERLLASLFTERTTAEPGAATPLAVWVRTYLATNPYSNNDSTGREKHLDIILEFSKGADLGIVNGEGDTPLHAVARYGNDIVLRRMLECRPELLFRENATGRTPYELAEDAYLSKEVFSDPPSLDPAPETNTYFYGRRRRALRRNQRTSNILARKPEEFVEEAKDSRSDVEKVWTVCKEFGKAQKAQGTKRKLVSLVEASEVAKRLARKKGSRDEAEEKREGGEVESEKGDEVVVWMGMGLQADN